MAIKKSLADLPKPSKPEGLTPDASPRFVHLLAEELSKAPDKPVAMGTPFRFSDAGKCARYLSMKAAGIPTSDPMDLAGHHVTNVGTLVHEAWQAAVANVYPGAHFELKGAVGDLTSGSCDGLVDLDCSACGGDGHERGENAPCLPCDGKGSRRILLELKTTGGFAYKMMIGERGAAEGPRTGAIIQTALNARAHDADEAVICVLSNEAISKGAAERKGFSETLRFGAEWTFTRAQLEAEADREVKRLESIRELVEAGKLAPRHWPHEMPAGARIVDVDKSRWELRDGEDIVDTGAVWGGQGCTYCSMKTACAAIDDAGTPAIPAKDGEAA